MPTMIINTALPSPPKAALATPATREPDKPDSRPSEWPSSQAEAEAQAAGMLSRNWRIWSVRAHQRGKEDAFWIGPFNLCHGGRHPSVNVEARNASAERAIDVPCLLKTSPRPVGRVRLQRNPAQLA